MLFSGEMSALTTYALIRNVTTAKNVTIPTPLIPNPISNVTHDKPVADPGDISLSTAKLAQVAVAGMSHEYVVGNIAIV